MGPVMERSRESKKIFILASTLVIGGAEMVFRSLAENLESSGYNVELLFLREPGETGENLIEKGICFRRDISGSRFNPLALLRLFRIFRKNRDSVLLALDHHNVISLGGLASRCAGLRGSVLSVHSTGLWGSGRTFSRLDRIHLRLFDRIVALSDTHAGYLAEREGVPKSRMVVINNGIDTDRFNPADREEKGGRIKREIEIGDDETVVTIVAALRPEKNHVMFIESAGRVMKREESARFLIVGEGEQREFLEKETERRELRGRVTFLGSREDIPDILSASDISVLCSHPVVETFPLTVLEAMACGLPVISTDVGSLSDIITDRRDGILIPAGDSEALAENIIELIRNLNLRDRLGKNARRKVELKFSRQEMANNYLKMLGDLYRVSP